MARKKLSRKKDRTEIQRNSKPPVSRSTVLAPAPGRAPRSSPRMPVKAVVSRGGRPDLAGEGLSQASAPTLPIVGSRDAEVIVLNRLACDRRRSSKELMIVEGVGHLFEEAGALDAVARHAVRRFRHHLAGEGGA